MLWRLLSWCLGDVWISGLSGRLDSIRMCLHCNPSLVDILDTKLWKSWDRSLVSLKIWCSKVLVKNLECWFPSNCWEDATQKQYLTFGCQKHAMLKSDRGLVWWKKWVQTQYYPNLHPIQGQCFLVANRRNWPSWWNSFSSSKTVETLKQERLWVK